MSKFHLTKSDYAAGVQCEKRLYLLTHDPDSADSPSADLKLRFEQGRQIGELARTRFPSGLLVSETGSALPQAIAKTNSAVQELKVPAIFEAAFEFDSLVVRVDILKNNFDGSWDLIEVKSTTKLEQEHLDDVAFQLWVLKGAGVRVNKVYLSHVNNEVVFPDLEDFFTDHDLTEAAVAKLSEIETQVRTLSALLRDPEPPPKLIGRQCANPYTCEFKSQCWKDVPKGSVLELYNYRKRKPTKFELFHRGPKLIRELTDEIELTRFQQIQQMASHSDQPIIDYIGLSEFLRQVKYPIYYFDFETIAPVIPFLPGMRPYQRIPVQFSCHIQRSPDAEYEHREFLASGDPGSDSRRECLRAMEEIFDTSGTVVAYHDDFERSLIRELAEQFPESSDFLLELESEFWDLEDVFQKFYYHRNFGGSVSIKKVLPYFEPEMKYDKLAIKNGGEAQAELFKLLTGELSREDRERIRQNLLIYCGQDSMAMVVIHRKLMEMMKLSGVRPMIRESVSNS